MRSSVGHRLWSAAPAAATLLAAAAIAMTASRILWPLLQPSEPPIDFPQPAAPDRLAGDLQARHLFGVGAGGVVNATGRVENLSLVGAVAGEGVALIAVDGRPAKAFHVGAEITPGVRLAAVDVRQVEVERQGGRESLRLPAGKDRRP
jgi:general secretion pathway protein C